MGIRAKLALLVPGLVAASLVAVASVAVEGERRGLTEDMRVRDQQVLEAIGVTAAVYVAENDMAGLDTLVAHVSAQRLDPDLRELAVLDHEGRVLAHTEPQQFNSLVQDDFSRLAVKSESARWAREGNDLRVGVPAVSGLRWATVTGRYSLARIDAAVTRLRWRWFGGVCSLAALIGLGLYLGLDRMVIRPVRTLLRAARAMAEGRLDARVPPLLGSELGELSDAFNRMAASLEKQHGELEKEVEQRTTQLREANVRLERLAVTDGLTGIFNHRRFQEALAQEVLRSSRSGRPLSVLMIDVDNFKRFNDSLGHPAGDEVLRKLAQILQEGLRATDFLARYGGEEFAILLPETPKDEALQVAERLRSAVEQGLQGAGRPVSISLGVATYGPDGAGTQALLSAADRALYVAKNRGRNRVVAAGAEAH